MIDQAQLAALMRIVYSREQQLVYAVLDGCMLAELPSRLQSSGCRHSCLFSGALDPVLERAAPWLVELPPHALFTQPLLRESWNEHGGILLATRREVDLYTLRNHLRRFLRVSGPGGRPMLFRFYDPRAFRIAMPQLRHGDYQAFLQPLESVYTEAEDPASMLHFTADGPAVGDTVSLPLSMQEARE
ncbi:MAG TPA: DUF4123 domain-containing protein [Rhodanobacter sp.]